MSPKVFLLLAFTRTGDVDQAAEAKVVLMPTRTKSSLARLDVEMQNIAAEADHIAQIVVEIAHAGARTGRGVTAR